MLTMGCQPEATSPARTTLADSAGVTIASTPASALPSDTFATIAPEPVLELGQGENIAAADVLYRVADGLLLDDTSLAVLDGGSSEVRLYSLSGDLKGKSSGVRDGPGALKEPTALLPADSGSVVVWDAVAGTSNRFDRQGRLLETKRANLNVLAEELPRTLQIQPVWRWRQIGDSTLLIRDFLPAASAPEEGVYFRPEMELLVAPFSISPADTIGRYESLQQVRLPAGLSRPILPVNTLEASSPEREWLYVGDNAGFRIDRFSLDGTRDLVIQVTDYSPDASPEYMSNATSRFTQRLDQQGMEEPTEIIDMLPPQETRPSFSDLFAAADGNLWVRLAGPEFPGSHVVFDGSGTYAGHVDVSDHERILDIRYGLIVLLHKNELGVETISVHRLTRLR